LGMLSERRRVILSLHAEYFTLEEIAGIFGLSTSHIQRELKGAQKELALHARRVRTGSITKIKKKGDNS